MPQAAQGSGYSLQSFLKKNQKRISTAIPHASPAAVRIKRQLYICPGHLNPMARMPIKHNCFYQYYRQEEQRDRTKPKNYWDCFPKNLVELTTLEFNNKLTIYLLLRW